MAWTAPRTWVTTEVVTSSIMNTHVRDNLLAIHHPVHVENSTITVTNTATETTLFTAAPTIAANALGTSGWLRVYLWGTYANNTSTRTLTFRVKFGGVTHIAEVIGTPTAAAGTQAVRFEVDIINTGATNTQLVMTHWVGLKPGDSADFDHSVAIANSRATGAIDTTANQTLDITVQWSVIDAATSWVENCSRVMLMQG
jgi:hypothetical protein